MCGKFTQLSSWDDVHAFSQPLTVSTGEVVVSTPMRTANIMRLNANGEREMVQMRWGFAGKDDAAPTRPKHMHARSETIDTLPTFKRACGILMVHTFNDRTAGTDRTDSAAAGSCATRPRPATRPCIRSHQSLFA